MTFVFLFLVFVFWLLFWSFSTVLISRWHSHESWILLWRSKCPKCHHTLSWYELFPVLSYIFLSGRCRACKSKISLFYPLAELLMGTIFVLLTIAYTLHLSYAPDAWYLLLLMLWFVTWVYVLSDLRYMEIPDEILVPAIFGYAGLLVLWYFSSDIASLFFDRSSYIGSYSDYLSDHFLAALVLYTFLYLQILIPATIGLSKQGKWKEIGDVALSYFLFPYFLLFPPKNTKDNQEIELETWVGWGDLRIALFIGLTLGLMHGVFAFFVAYMVGSIIGIFVLFFHGKRKAQIPFWPFLALGWISAIYFHDGIVQVLEVYKSLF